MTYSYTAIVEREGASWNAYVPDLPGCVATAETEDAVRELIRGAVEAHVALLQERGFDVPPPRIGATVVDVAV